MKIIKNSFNNMFKKQKQFHFVFLSNPYDNRVSSFEFQSGGE